MDMKLNESFLSLTDWYKFKKSYDRRQNYLDLFKTMFYISSDKWTKSDKMWFCAKRVFEQCGYYPNFTYPKTFIENVNFYKFNYENPLMTFCCDKVTFKKYVEQILSSEEYCAQLYGVYDSVDKIDFSKLPNTFVLKSNCGSGSRSVILVEDKDKINVDLIKRRISNWLVPWNNVYYHTFDWAYLNIKPLILIESLLQNRGYEYKIYCFNGKAEFLHVVNDSMHNNEEPFLNFYDINWNRLEGRMFYKNFPYELPKPKILSELIEISEALSKPFPFVRVDFMENLDNGLAKHSKVCAHLTELTFYPGSGLNAIYPYQADLKFGGYFRNNIFNK